MEKQKLLIEKTAAEKLWSYTMLCKSEISGLGRVQVVDGKLLITDVAIFKQVVSSAHSTIEAAALAEFQAERVRAGESMKDWCLWWHSHAEMAVFFSGTDTGTIESSTEFPYLVSLVVNRKRESKARLDFYSPVRAVLDLELEEITVENKEITELCQKDIDEKVSQAVVNVAPRHTGFSTTQRTYSSSRREDDYDYKDYDMPRKYNQMSDEEITQEYRDQKEYLRKQLDFLRKKKGLRYETAFKQRQEELIELVTWGMNVGLEKSTTRGK